ncbi:Ppx/GppA phosphatase family protein [Marinovum sp.]|uniref:Ppx/GppA phosphatase family protein n=1 Tax=Marinovum sp. TaxID=2024839 RepID=UPI002B26B75D|nr:Ppx/GppA phosphatase family protein [Marinovum sp.]
MQGSGQGDLDPRVIEIETGRVLDRQQAHYGVIDVGSNSIRLVVYDDLSRAPFPRFNEKSLVALGAGLGDDGRFSDETIARAVDAITRMSAIAKAMDVTRIDVLATEATRKAKNGDDLIAAITEATGLKPRILAGEEEAHFTAYGVISGFFQPKGMIGDIGGGSLEVAEVIGDRVSERVTSMPLGALPVKARLEAGYGEAKQWVDGILAESLPPLLTEPVFHAIGGGWRALARVRIAQDKAPITVVHGFEMPAEELRKMAKTIAKMTPEEVAELPDVPGRRIETLAASALVMSRVLKKLAPERVVFSAFGLREGWIYRQLDEDEQYRDPLLECAQTIGLPTARVPEFSAALGRWTDDLFPGETLAGRRLRLAACALTDIGWRDHEKIRPKESFQRLLQFPFVGITHPERAFLAVTILCRYGGKLDGEVRAVTDALLAPADLRRAEILGRVMQLGHRFSAAVPEILDHARLEIEADAVRLKILDPRSNPDSDAVLDRLKKVAKATGVEVAEIV